MVEVTDKAQPPVDLLREARELRNHLRQLSKHPGYLHYTAKVQQQINNRMRMYGLKPLESLDKVPEQEFAKGEMAGLELAKVIVENQLTHLDTEITALEATIAADEIEREE